MADDMERLAPALAGMRTYTVSIDLNDGQEAELAELAEHAGLSREDVLREAIGEGLAMLKLHREIDLAPADPVPAGNRTNDRSALLLVVRRGVRPVRIEANRDIHGAGGLPERLPGRLNALLDHAAITGKLRFERIPGGPEGRIGVELFRPCLAFDAAHIRFGCMAAAEPGRGWTSTLMLTCWSRRPRMVISLSTVKRSNLAFLMREKSA